MLLFMASHVVLLRSSLLLRSSEMFSDRKNVRSYDGSASSLMRSGNP